MKTYFLPYIERYLRREGLSAFLPASNDKTLFSVTTLLLICVCVAPITHLYDKSFLFGLGIPLIVLVAYTLAVILYIIVRALVEIIKSKKRQKFSYTNILIVLQNR